MAEPIEIPDEILRAAPVNPAIAANADWALKFRNSTTNFAQRSRYRGDINAYAQQLLASREAAEQAMLAKDAGARALIQMKQNMEHKRQLHPLNVQIKEGQLAAQAAAEMRRAKEEAVKVATQAEENQFYSDLADFELNNPGGVDDETLISLGKKYPRARKSKEADALLTQAERRREAARKLAEPAKDKVQWMEDGTAIIGTTAYRHDDRGNLVKIGTEKAETAEKPKDSLDQFNADLAAAVKSAGGEAKVTPETWKAFEARKAKILATPGAASATAAPAAAAPPANQAALDWLAANPDDPRAAAIKAKLGIK